MNKPAALSLLLLATSSAGCQPVTGDVPISGDAPNASGYLIETVLIGLERPWAVAWLPGEDGSMDAGDMLITERPGRLRIVRDGELLMRPAADIPDVFASGQGGLMDVALHPEFADNSFVYLTYSEGDRSGNRTVLARGTLAGDTLEALEVIFRVNITKEGSQHFGSRILWLPDGTMLLAVGDGGNPPASYEGEWIRNQAQISTAHLGKTLHLTDEGQPASEIAAYDDGLPEVYSLGHRNIQGLAYDATTDTIWATEHGARGGDELNIIERGANYGWPEVTYSREYSGPRISDQTSAEGVTDPEVVWTPCKAPCGLAFYTGDAFPEWQGDLFSGALVGRHIRRIDLDGTEVVGQETIAINGRVRDVRQGPDGLIYLVTDEQAGELLRLVPQD